jgi:hypothetical protein
MGEHLLDTYEAERRPVAEQLIAFTAQLMGLAMIDNREVAVLRNDVLAAVEKVPGVADWLANKLSQLDIAYAPARPDDPMAGRRIDPRIAVPRGLSWTLLTPPGVSIANAPEDVTLTTSGAVTEPVAVRPDGVAADPALAAEALGVGIPAASVPVGKEP